MFKNVLVGVDGRPTGRDAIALATRLLDPEGKLTLANVHSDVLARPTPPFQARSRGSARPPKTCSSVSAPKPR